MNIWIHRTAEPNGITCKQKKAAEVFDLVKFLFAIIHTHFDPVFMNQ